MAALTLGVFFDDSDDDDDMLFRPGKVEQDEIVEKEATATQRHWRSDKDKTRAGRIIPYGNGTEEDIQLAILALDKLCGLVVSSNNLRR